MWSPAASGLIVAIREPAWHLDVPVDRIGANAEDEGNRDDEVGAQAAVSQGDLEQAAKRYGRRGKSRATVERLHARHCSDLCREPSRQVAES